jgi:hypothetical protein
VVRHEARPGKGGVVRRMFAAGPMPNAYGDGPTRDATYDASRAPSWFALTVSTAHLDMVTAACATDTRAWPRVSAQAIAPRNRAFTWLLGTILRRATHRHVLPAIALFSRRFVKVVSAVGARLRGFEPELVVHALRRCASPPAMLGHAFTARVGEVARQSKPQQVARRAAHPRHDS